MNITNNDNRLPFFPIIKKGETVYSAVCRCVVRAHQSDEHVLRWLTGRQEKTTLLSALPGYIHSISKAMPQGNPWQDSRKIVIENTNLTYFLYFDSQEQRDFYINQLAIAESSHSLIMSLGLTKYKGGAVTHHPRFCQKCVEADELKWGFTIFRREHQLPGVAVCHVHGEVLANGCTVCGLYPIRNYGMTMAGKCLCPDGVKPLTAFPELPSNVKALRWIAAESAFMVNSAGSQCKDIRETLRVMATHLRYSRGKIMDYQALAGAIERRFGKDLLDWLGTPVWNGSQASPWVRRILNKNSETRRSPAIYFLLIIGTLFDNVFEFERAVKGLNDDGFLPPVITEKPLINKTESVSCAGGQPISEVISKAKCGLPGMAQKLGVSVYALISEIKHNDLCVPLSRQTQMKLGENRIDSIKKALLKGMAKTGIMEKFGCSEWALTLIELDCPSLYNKHLVVVKKKTRDKFRKNVLDIISHSPKITRSELQKQYSGTYDYMIKQDKEWFYSKIPLCKQKLKIINRKLVVDWSALDAKKAVELEESLIESVEDSKPVRLTEQGMLKRVGLQSQYRENEAKFPRVSKILEREVENTGDYYDRRIRWAVAQMGKKGDPVSVNKLRRVAALPAKIIRAHKGLVISEAKGMGIKISDRSFFAKPGEDPPP